MNDGSTVTNGPVPLLNEVTEISSSSAKPIGGCSAPAEIDGSVLSRTTPMEEVALSPAALTHCTLK